jgi:hypothetical protein
MSLASKGLKVYDYIPELVEEWVSNVTTWQIVDRYGGIFRSADIGYEHQIQHLVKDINNQLANHPNLNYKLSYNIDTKLDHVYIPEFDRFDRRGLFSVVCVMWYKDLE